MLSLVDLPEDVLMNIFRYLDGTSLSNFASTHGRFRSSAAQWIKSMTIPSVNRHVHEFLSSAEVSVHSLDLSNCYSEASTIESLIFGCRSIRDLNIVNCNLPFPKLRLLLRSLTELETLSFSFVGPPDNYAAALIDGDDENEIQTPIKRLYIEVNTSWESLYFVPDVLSMCFALEHLHLHFIGCVDPLEPTEFETQALDELAWEKLRTVVVSACEYASLLIPVLLSYLFETRLTEIDLRRWKYLNLPCFVFENGKFNTYDPAAIQPGRENLLRNAYLVQFVSDDEEDMDFPWGPPRGLKIICDEPELAGIAARFFTAPVTWASDLTELDLVECLSELPNGANWLNLFVSSPALEAIAIPSSFFPSQAEDLEDYSQPKRRRGWRYDVLSFLTTVKLKRLLITDPGPLPDDSSDYDTPPVERSFRGIDRLLHLEELTMHLVTVTSSIFRSLANSNVRIARFQLMGASNLDGLKEFIERSVGLKYLKLEATELPLGSGLLWEALANGKSLKQICVGTNSRIEVDLTPIATYLPQIIDRISVLHIHADGACNRNFLNYTLRTFMDLYLKRYPGREVNFESDSLVSPNRLMDPLIYPGRRLCHISNHIARIKPIGWDLS